MVPYIIIIKYHSCDMTMFRMRGLMHACNICVNALSRYGKANWQECLAPVVFLLI
jgi:hypothetical protein